MINIVLIVITVLVVAVIIIRYLEGDFSVTERHLVASNTYNVYKKNAMAHEWTPSGKATKETYKIIYVSGRIKYKNYTFKH